MAKKLKETVKRKTSLKQFEVFATSPCIDFDGVYWNVKSKIDKVKGATLDSGQKIQIVETIELKAFGDNARFVKLFKGDGKVGQNLTLRGIRVLLYVVSNCLKVDAISVKIKVSELVTGMKGMTAKAVYLGICDLLQNEYLWRRIDSEGIKDEYFINHNRFFNGDRRDALTDVKNVETLRTQRELIMLRSSSKNNKVTPNNDFDNEKA